MLESWPVIRATKVSGLVLWARQRLTECNPLKFCEHFIFAQIRESAGFAKI